MNLKRSIFSILIFISTYAASTYAAGYITFYDYKDNLYSRPNVINTTTIGDEVEVEAKLSWGVVDINCRLSDGRTVFNSSNFSGTRMIRFRVNTEGLHTFSCTYEGGRKKETIQFYVGPFRYYVDLSVRVNGGAPKKLISTSERVFYSPFQKRVFNNNGIVAKVGEPIDIIITARAADSRNQNGRGVNSYLDLKNSITEFRPACPNQSVSKTTSKIQFKNGVMTNKQSQRIVFNDAFDGKIQVVYRDDSVNKSVDFDAGRGRCLTGGFNVANLMCPFPPIFFLSFNVKVLPNNFKVKIQDKGNDKNILYYGQGNDGNGVPSKVSLIALNKNNQPLKNYVNGCASFDTTLSLEDERNSVNITLGNPSGGREDKNFPFNTFTANSTSTMDKLLLIKKKDGTNFLPKDVAEPSYMPRADVGEVSYTRYPNYPKYNRPFLDSNFDIAILRGRINAIDSDNTENYAKMPDTKIYYEFYCKTCDLKRLSKITGIKAYKTSPTVYDWYIDESFERFTSDKVDPKSVEVSSGLRVSGAGVVSKGVQSIQYNKAPSGQYSVKIKQDGKQNSFPSYLLYAPYYRAGTTNLGTSSILTVYTKLANDNRDFGLDTGNAKNTRGRSRISGY